VYDDDVVSLSISDSEFGEFDEHDDPQQFESAVQGDIADRSHLSLANDQALESNTESGTELV
jgi:hypothetical protein